MPAMSLAIVIKSNRVPEIRSKFPSETKRIIQAVVLQLGSSADPNTPVDTGNLKNNKTMGADYITWHAPYTGFVNYGTRNMAARPFIDEAVSQVAPMFTKAMAAMAKGL